MGSGLRKEERERNTIFVPKPTLTCRLLLLAALHLVEGISCSRALFEVIAPFTPKKSKRIFLQ